MGPGVGVGDPCGSLPPRDILGRETREETPRNDGTASCKPRLSPHKSPRLPGPPAVAVATGDGGGRGSRKRGGAARRCAGGRSRTASPRGPGRAVPAGARRGGCSARRFSVAGEAAAPPWAASSPSAGSRRRAGSSKEPARSRRPARRRRRSTAGTSEPRYGAAGRASGMRFPVRLCAGSLGFVLAARQRVPLAGAGRRENTLSVRCELRSAGPQTFRPCCTNVKKKVCELM